jgi:arsenite methyltransferase
VDEYVNTSSAGSGCCAFYEQDWVHALAEDSFHPGGDALTRRTVAAMALPDAASVLDLGCGTGTTALMLARHFDYRITGLDLAVGNIERARERAGAASDRLEFVHTDVQQLPFADASFDGALAECVFSLMPDKAGALAEIRRVLKPGGRVGLTDMSIAGQLPGDLAEVVAPWTCLADALSPQGYHQCFVDAGFEVQTLANESDGLRQMIADIKRRLLMLGAGSLLSDEVAQAPALDLATLKHWLDRFRDEVNRGSIRYLRFQLRCS